MMAFPEGKVPGAVPSLEGRRIVPVCTLRRYYCLINQAAN